MTLGTGGRGPQARSVPQGPAVWLWRKRRFGSDSYSFLVGSESDVRHWGAVARRPGPSLRALLFGCSAGAVLGQTASFLVGSESDVRHWGPVARRPGPSLRALLFGCGAGAVLGQTAIVFL